LGQIQNCRWRTQKAHPRDFALGHDCPQMPMQDAELHYGLAQDQVLTAPPARKGGKRDQRLHAAIGLFLGGARQGSRRQHHPRMPRGISRRLQGDQSLWATPGHFDQLA
jgi:hypothetical protein